MKLFFAKKRQKPFPKTRPKRLKKSEDEKEIFLQAAIGPGFTGKMSGPYRFLLDTGDSGGLTVPIRWLDANDIPYSLVGETDIELANGENQKVPIAMFDLQIVVGSESPVLFGVEATIVPEGEDPIIGMEALDAYNFTVSNSILMDLRPNWDKFQNYEQWTSKSVKKRAIGYYKPTLPALPENMKEDAHGFYAPIKPLGPLKPLEPLKPITLPKVKN